VLEIVDVIKQNSLNKKNIVFVGRYRLAYVVARNGLYFVGRTGVRMGDVQLQESRSG
jgi:hypothetical protein